MISRNIWLEPAARFGSLVAHQDYSSAWLMLTKEAQASNPAEAMRAAVEARIAYASGPIWEAQVIEEADLEDWPDKRAGDIAVV